MSQEQVEIVRRVWAALNEDPPRLLFEAFSEDLEMHNPPEFPMRGPFGGIRPRALVVGTCGQSCGVGLFREEPGPTPR
jgi:hypothetical protein